MIRIYLRPLLASVVLLACSPVMAEEKTLDEIGCTHMVIEPIFDADNMNLVSWTAYTITRPQGDQGEPETTQYCEGTTLTHGDRRTARGYCKVMYPGGEQALVELSREGEGPGNWRMIDGTGKYQGVTGEGQYHFITQARPVEEGTWQFCIRSEGSYTLK